MDENNCVVSHEVSRVERLQGQTSIPRLRSCSFRPSGLTCSLLLVAIITVLSYASIFQRQTVPFSALHPFTKNAAGISASSLMLGIELHPEDHVSRGPVEIVHHWNITSGFRSPDGVRKRVYLVNGEFLGPTIECRSGDKLVVHVTNSLEEEGLSIHWHGLHMRNANSMDGAVGFTQCPIPSHGLFTYEFDIEDNQSGTFWWHAHSQVQRGDGLYGGLVVHDPKAEHVENMVSGYEKGVLLLISDWYHRSAEEVLGWYTSARGFGNEVRRCNLILRRKT